MKNKYLSVVFWDISGFANLCNKLLDEPFAITELLKSYFQEANDIIHRRDGIIDKFIGDGIWHILDIPQSKNMKLHHKQLMQR